MSQRTWAFTIAGLTLLFFAILIYSDRRASSRPALPSDSHPVLVRHGVTLRTVLMSMAENDWPTNVSATTFEDRGDCLHVTFECEVVPPESDIVTVGHERLLLAPTCSFTTLTPWAVAGHVRLWHVTLAHADGSRDARFVDDTWRQSSALATRLRALPRCEF